MTIAYISRKVTELKKRYPGEKPEGLCRELGISLLYQPMGTGSSACKGFYLRHSRQQVVVVNSTFTESMQQVILAHELGHAVLHRNVSRMRAFHDFSLFYQTSAYEYEANIFAADYLLDDAELLALLYRGTTIFKAASLLRVPGELLDFKLRVLQQKGYAGLELPLQASADFLKNAKPAGDL